MPIPHAEQMLERAQKGERLQAKERRHCVAYLIATKPELTNVSMGHLFQVSEGCIRDDIKRIRQEKAKLIKEDDIALVIADLVMTRDIQLRDLEISKKKAKLGSRAYIEHCKSIMDTMLRTTKALQDLGWYPKNLGNLTVDKFEYRAIVNERDGSVDTQPTELNKEEILEAEFEEIEPRQLEAPAEAAA